MVVSFGLTTIFVIGWLIYMEEPRMRTPRVIVHLDPAKARALATVAERENRHPRDQARLFIIEGLCQHAPDLLISSTVGQDQNQEEEATHGSTAA